MTCKFISGHKWFPGNFQEFEAIHYWAKPHQTHIKCHIFLTCAKLEIHQLFDVELRIISPLRILQWHYLLEKPLTVGVRKWLVRAGVLRVRKPGVPRQTHTHTWDILPLAFLVPEFQWTKEGGRQYGEGDREKAREWEGRALKSWCKKGVKSVMMGGQLLWDQGQCGNGHDVRWS